MKVKSLVTEIHWLVTPGHTQCDIEGRAAPLTRAPAILGLLFGGFIGSWPFLIAAFFYWGMQATPDVDEQDLNFIRVAFVLFSLVCLIPSGYVIHRSLLLLFGKKRIRIDEKHLRLITQLGPLRHTRSALLDQLIGFRIESAEGMGPSMLQGSASLFAIRASGKRVMLLRAFPSDYLQKLVEHLEQQTRRITQQDFSRSPASTTAPSLRTETASLYPYSVELRETPPLGSNLSLRHQSDGVKIDLPNLGLKKTLEGGGGLFMAIFIVGELFILFGLIPALLLGKVEGQPIAGWIIAVVGTLINACLILGVLTAATRQGQILLQHDQLTLMDKNIWGTRINSWKATQIETIEVGVDEPTSDGDTTWTYYLKVSPSMAQPQKWFSNRSKEELEWVVTTLQAAVLEKSISRE